MSVWCQQRKSSIFNHVVRLGRAIRRNAEADRPAQSVHACGRNQDREHIDLKLCLQVLSELLEPSILSYVSELFASHRAFEFEFAQVLEVMNHFVHQDRLLCGSRSGPGISCLLYTSD